MHHSSFITVVIIIIIIIIILVFIIVIIMILHRDHGSSSGATLHRFLTQFHSDGQFVVCIPGIFAG